MRASAGDSASVAVDGYSPGGASAAALTSVGRTTVEASGSARSRAGQLEEASSQYDRVAAKLIFAGDAGSFTLAVTSSLSGEGVSTVCSGITRALASSTSKQVVLVDANLRRPALHDLFGLPLQPGLHEVIEGNENCEWWPDATEPYGALGPKAVATTVPNLWLVPSGAAMEHPAQVTTSEGARTAVWGLRARFNFIVIDCPPVLSAVDAASICRLADGVLIVVRAGLTPREDVKRARELLRGMPVMGVILNGV